MKERSIFGRKFTELYRQSVKNSEPSDRDKMNLYFLPGFIDDLLTFYMPLAPLWTGVALYDKQSRKTRLVLFYLPKD